MPDQTNMYQPLSRERKEIRLLQLISVSDDEIACTLEAVSLQDGLPFTALSYVWGDHNNRESITVNGQTMDITVSLASALRHAGMHWQRVFPDRTFNSFRLWADALCINQSDPVERGQQVGLMADIYTTAELVFSWLGQENDETLNLAMDTIQLLHEATTSLSLEDFQSFLWLQNCPDLLTEDFNALEFDLFTHPRWNSLVVFYELPYWKRIWIFQEVVLSKDVLLVCPSGSLHFDILNSISLLFHAAIRSVAKPESLSSVGWAHISSIPWPYVTAMGSSKLLTLSDHPPHDPATVSRTNWTISTVAGQYDATDPRDHIYGLLALSNIGIEPDYRPSKSLGQVYEDYVSARLTFLRDGGNQDDQLPPLFFLKYAREPSADSNNLPSWAPAYHQPAKDSKFLYGSLIYGSSSKADDGLGMDFRGSLLRSSLFVRGVQIGSILQLLELEDPPTAENENSATFAGQLLSFAEVYHDSDSAGLRTIFCLLSGMELATITKETLLLTLAFLYLLFKDAFQQLDDIEEAFCAIRFPSDPDLFTETFLEVFFPDCTLEDLKECGFGDDVLPIFASGLSGNMDEVVGFLTRRMIHLHAAWAFAKISGGPAPHAALVPKSVSVDDVLCVVKGYPNPIILRGNGDTWQYISPCFVVGLMDGQVSELLAGGHAFVEKLEIV